MYCKFEILNPSKVWEEFGKVIAPFTVGETLRNDTTTSYSVNISVEGADFNKGLLKPGQICRINLFSRTLEFVIIDAGKVEPKQGLSHTAHSYVLQELICYTRDSGIQTAMFSFDKYSAPSFFERLLALTEDGNQLELLQTDDYEELLTNWTRADFQIASPTLLDNLVKIGPTNGVRFKARMNGPKIGIYAKSLRGSTTITTINGNKIGASEQFLGANYATRAAAQIRNMAADQYKWIPSQRPISGLKLEPETEYKTEMTAADACLKLPYPIRGCTRVAAQGHGRIITNSTTQWPGFVGSDYRVFTNDGVRIYPETNQHVSIIYTEEATFQNSQFAVVSENEWSFLDPSGSQGATRHKLNTLYYKKESNTLHNFQVTESLSNSIETTRLGYIEVWSGGALISTTDVRQKIELHKAKYVALANLYIDGEITAKNQSNTPTNKRTTIYSQEENVVSGRSLITNLQNYIDSMDNADEVLTYEFNQVSDIPEAGQIYEGKVIADVTMEISSTKIKATLVLSDEIVKKSEYLSADTGLNLPAIPIDKAFQRTTNYSMQVWICESLEKALAKRNSIGGDETFNLTNYAFMIMDGLRNVVQTPIQVESAVLRTGEIEGDSVITAAPAAFMAINNNLVITYKTRDNLSIGTLVDHTIGETISQARYYPISFINSSGFSKKVHLKLAVESPDSQTPTLSQFNGITPMVNIIDEKYYHDPIESINVVWQMSIKSEYAKGRVAQLLYEDGRFFADRYTNPDIYKRRVKFKKDGSTTWVKYGDIIEVLQTSADWIRTVSIEVNGTMTTDNTGEIYVYRQLASNNFATEEPIFKARATTYINTTTGKKYLRVYLAFTK